MSGTFPNDQYDLLEDVAKRLHQFGIRYFVTGSQASTLYGEPRFTLDIDIVIELTQENVSQFIKLFHTDEFYLSESAVRDAVERRGMFNLLQPATGGKVDFVVAKDSEFDRSRMLRARSISIGDGVNATFASAEDVILKKLQWYQQDNSDRHIRDIVGVLRVQADAIDTIYLQDWIRQLDVSDVWSIVLDTLSS